MQTRGQKRRNSFINTHVNDITDINVNNIDNSYEIMDHKTIFEKSYEQESKLPRYNNEIIKSSTYEHDIIIKELKYLNRTLNEKLYNCEQQIKDFETKMDQSDDKNRENTKNLETEIYELEDEICELQDELEELKNTKYQEDKQYALNLSSVNQDYENLQLKYVVDIERLTGEKELIEDKLAKLASIIQN